MQKYHGIESEPILVMLGINLDMLTHFKSILGMRMQTAVFNKDQRKKDKSFCVDFLVC